MKLSFPLPVDNQKACMAALEDEGSYSHRADDTGYCYRKGQVKTLELHNSPFRTLSQKQFPSPKGHPQRLV